MRILITSSTSQNIFFKRQRHQGGASPSSTDRDQLRTWWAPQSRGSAFLLALAAAVSHWAAVLEAPPLWEAPPPGRTRATFSLLPSFLGIGVNQRQCSLQCPHLCLTSLFPVTVTSDIAISSRKMFKKAVEVLCSTVAHYYQTKMREVSLKPSSGGFLLNPMPSLQPEHNKDCGEVFTRSDRSISAHRAILTVTLTRELAIRAACDPRSPLVCLG